MGHVYKTVNIIIMPIMVDYTDHSRVIVFVESGPQINTKHAITVEL